MLSHKRKAAAQSSARHSRLTIVAAAIPPLPLWLSFPFPAQLEDAITTAVIWYTSVECLFALVGLSHALMQNPHGMPLLVVNCATVAPRGGSADQSVLTSQKTCVH